MRRARWEKEQYEPKTDWGYPKGMPSELAGPGCDGDEEEQEREAIVHEQEAPESATEFPFGHNAPNNNNKEER